MCIPSVRSPVVYMQTIHRLTQFTKFSHLTDGKTLWIWPVACSTVEITALTIEHLQVCVMVTVWHMHKRKDGKPCCIEPNTNCSGTVVIESCVTHHIPSRGEDIAMEEQCKKLCTCAFVLFDLSYLQIEKPALCCFDTLNQVEHHH